MLLSIIYGMLVRSKNLNLLLGCPTTSPTVASVKALIDELPVFKYAEQLATVLAFLHTLAVELLFRICATFGPKLTVAKES